MHPLQETEGVAVVTELVTVAELFTVNRYKFILPAAPHVCNASPEQLCEHCVLGAVREESYVLPQKHYRQDRQIDHPLLIRILPR